MSQAKFRPYLTLQQMERIVSLCGYTDPKNNLFPIDQEIIQALKLMILKAQHSITKPAFIPLVAKLGIPEPKFIPPQTEEEILEEQRFLTGAMTPEEAQAYQSKLMEKISSSSN